MINNCNVAGAAERPACQIPRASASKSSTQLIPVTARLMVSGQPQERFQFTSSAPTVAEGTIPARMAIKRASGGNGNGNCREKMIYSRLAAIKAEENDRPVCCHMRRTSGPDVPACEPCDVYLS